MASNSLILVAVVLLAGQVAQALPQYWLNKSRFAPASCGAHPKQAYGPHLPPQKDTKIVFIVKPAAGGAAIKAGGTIRKGVKYSVKATWAQSTHHGLLTVSQGTLGVTTGAPATCKRSFPTATTTTSITNTFTLPKTAKGNLTLGVTHSQPGAPYYQGTVTFKIAATAGKLL